MINNIKINDDRTVEQTFTNMGNQYENKVSSLNFTFPSKIENVDITDYKKYLEVSAQNIKYIAGEITSDIFILENNITRYTSVDCQVVFKKSDTKEDWRSNQFSFKFNPSINAEQILPAQRSEFDKIKEELETAKQQVNDLVALIQTKLDNGEFNGKVINQFNGEEVKLWLSKISELPAQLDEEIHYIVD